MITAKIAIPAIVNGTNKFTNTLRVSPENYLEKMRLPRTNTFLLTLTACVLGAGCFSNSKSNTETEPESSAFAGTVVDGADNLVAGATVYLIPNTAIDTTEITSEDIRSGSAEDRDEPLEDAVAAGGTTFTQAVTDSAGAFEFDEVPDGEFFVYVEPAGTEYIPGGSWCRDSVDASGLRTNLDATILISSSPSTAATYVGMTSCLVCHPDEDTEKGAAHRLGFTVPNKLSSLQDDNEHPDVFEGNGYFKLGTSYLDGFKVYLHDPDFSRGFDDFQTSITDPALTGGVVYAILWLWKDASEKYYITIENIINTGDTMSPATREVKLNYGGPVYKQRYMIEWPGLNGLYPILQFQPAGDEDKFDRTRKQFRDYHFDFFWDKTLNEIKTPDVTKNINRNCLGCHATGYTQFVDSGTGEVLCDSLEDPGGEYDIDGDGTINDLNIGCETCHGPGSEHVAANKARFILAPENITPSREVMLCDRCHDRLIGNGPNTHNDVPMNPDGLFPPAGISRAEYLASFVETKGPTASQNWPDDIHAKSHHQHVPDYLKAGHYRNSSHLMSCSQCHNTHAGTGNEHYLREDPNDPDQPMCLTCHQDYIGTSADHTTEILGVAHAKGIATCVDCHMIKTAKTGSGDYGFLLDNPTGTSTDPFITYFENDITSHVFDVPRKTNVGVKGVTPGSAMPIPYTNSCGTCHDPSKLQF